MKIKYVVFQKSNGHVNTWKHRNALYYDQIFRPKYPMFLDEHKMIIYRNSIGTYDSFEHFIVFPHEYTEPTLLKDYLKTLDY